MPAGLMVNEFCPPPPPPRAPCRHIRARAHVWEQDHTRPRSTTPAIRRIEQQTQTLQNTEWNQRCASTDPPFCLTPQNNSITVPGTSIGAAGFGTGNGIQRHSYVGVSWYTKIVSVPPAWLLDSDDGAMMALSVGGVKSSAMFWVDGQLGEPPPQVCPPAIIGSRGAPAGSP